MITFNVVRETLGWSNRRDERMTPSFWSRDPAIRDARGLAASSPVSDAADPAGDDAVACTSAGGDVRPW